MKLIVFLSVLFSFAPGVCGQTSPNTSTDPASVKFYRGEDNFAFDFETSQSRYSTKSHIAGFDISLFDVASQSIKLEDGWQDDFDIILPYKGESRDVFKITSIIDFKTGLLKKITFDTSESLEEYLISDSKITLNQTINGRTQQFVFDNREKIYPCSYSNAFYALMPLSDNFSGSFACLVPSQTKEKPAVMFTKLTVKVDKTETVTTKSGTFDCYKLKIFGNQAINESEQKSGGKNNKDIKKVSDLPIKDLRRANFSDLWIDKKSRKVIMAKLDSKLGAVVVEIQK